MENNQVSYIKADDNKLINEKSIKWIRKVSNLVDCLEICTKSSGCLGSDTHKICKVNNAASYNKLMQQFE
jgi:hypothetical protein